MILTQRLFTFPHARSKDACVVCMNVFMCNNVFVVHMKTNLLGESSSRNIVLCTVVSARPSITIDGATAVAPAHHALVAYIHVILPSEQKGVGSIPP